MIECLANIVAGTVVYSLLIFAQHSKKLLLLPSPSASITTLTTLPAGEQQLMVVLVLELLL